MIKKGTQFKCVVTNLDYKEGQLYTQAHDSEALHFTTADFESGWSPNSDHFQLTSKRFNYLIAFHHSDGFASVEVALDSEITSLDQIRQALKPLHQFTLVAPINFQLLRTYND